MSKFIKNRSFYSFAVFMFVFFTAVHFFAMLLYGISSLRLAGFLGNLWFAVKTIDIIEEQFGTPYTSVFWRKWVLLRNKTQFSFTEPAVQKSEDNKSSS